MTADQWISQFSGELGVDALDQDQIDKILKLASIAAHASERIAAPLACYLAGKTGKSLDDLVALAQELSNGND